MSEISLYYFNSYGRAETTRIILKYIGWEFNDVRLSDEEWVVLKDHKACEFNQIPMLSIDGYNLVQSRSIERYILRKAGLYPTDFYLAYKTECLIAFFDDIVEQLYLLF